MKRPSKIVAVLIAIPIVISLFFSSNIYNYFRFKSYCSDEGGLRVYEKLEKNIGLMADDYDSAHMAAQLKYIDFVRYKEKKDGLFYDLRYIGGEPQSINSYSKVLADESKHTLYYWNEVNYFVKNEKNLFKFGYEITDINRKNMLARYYMFEYLLYIGPLDSKSTQSCFREGGSSISDIARWRKELISVFKN